MSEPIDKVCFITGASGGVGKALALRLLNRGMKVFAFSRSKSLADEKENKNLYTFQGNVGNEVDVKSAFETCVKVFGGVDILVNNAGVGMATPDLSVTDVNAFDEMMNTNVRGVFLCTREALKIMKPAKSGHVVTIVSMAGQRTNPVAPVYCASKFGARGFSSGLADQVIKEGIKVTDVNPGPIDSNYWGDRKVPREKFLTVDDAAGVIEWVVTLPQNVLIRDINFDSMKYLAG